MDYDGPAQEVLEEREWARKYSYDVLAKKKCVCFLPCFLKEAKFKTFRKIALAEVVWRQPNIDSVL